MGTYTKAVFLDALNDEERAEYDAAEEARISAVRTMSRLRNRASERIAAARVKAAKAAERMAAE